MQQEDNYCIRFGISDEWKRYVFPKGYIALNGASLTVSAVDKQAGWFEVWLIPETRRMTTFEAKQAGDLINVEIERERRLWSIRYATRCMKAWVIYCRR